MENYIIWIIGANASGKSTLSAEIQLRLRQMHPLESDDIPEPIFITDGQDGQFLYTTTSGVSANLGKFNHPRLYGDNVKTNACCGTDTLPTKALIARSLREASVNNVPFIFVEGIMATRQWVKLFPRRYKILLILLDVDIEFCLSRLLQRRSEKTGLSVGELAEQLTEKTYQNVFGKIAGFKRMFADLSLRRDITSLYCQVDEDFRTSDIAEIVINTIMKNGKF